MPNIKNLVLYKKIIQSEDYELSEELYKIIGKKDINYNWPDTYKKYFFYFIARTLQIVKAIEDKKLSSASGLVRHERRLSDRERLSLPLYIIDSYYDLFIKFAKYVFTNFDYDYYIFSNKLYSSERGTIGLGSNKKEINVCSYRVDFLFFRKINKNIKYDIVSYDIIFEHANKKIIFYSIALEKWDDILNFRQVNNLKEFRTPHINTKLHMIAKGNNYQDMAKVIYRIHNIFAHFFVNSVFLRDSELSNIYSMDKQQEKNKKIELANTVLLSKHIRDIVEKDKNIILPEKLQTKEEDIISIFENVARIEKKHFYNNLSLKINNKLSVFYCV